MSTFEENIANLRRNNKFSINEIKTYNTDVARFESKKLQRQGELFLLAGELGANLVEKIAANREKDAINEEYISYYEKQWKEYEQSDAAAEAEKKFKSNANNQNILSDNLVPIEGAGAPSDDVSEARISTGKHVRLREQLKTSNLASRYGAWVNNQLLNNDSIFFAEIDGKVVKLQVNDPNLTFKQKVAAHKYLTKEYLKLHDLQKYSRDFLYLPKERGGSGFMKSILETNQSAIESLRTAYKIELSENDITLATKNFANNKDSQSFKDLLSSLNAGYTTKGEPLNYAGAWKRLNDKILPQMIDAGLLPPDEVLKLGQDTTLMINGKEVILGKHRPLEWGENGKWHRKALEAWKEKGTRTKDEWDFKAEKGMENTLKLIKDGEFSKTDMINASIEIQQMASKGNNTTDFTELDSYINSKYDTQEEADIRAREILNNFNDPKGKGWRLDEILLTEDIRVKNSSVLTRAVAEDKRIWEIVDDGINQMKKNYFDLTTTAEGKDVWTIKSSGHYRKWKAVEGYAVRYFKHNRDKGITVADVWDATSKWEKSLGGDEKINTPYNQWDALEAKLEQKAAGGDKDAKTKLEEFRRKKDLMFVQDGENQYPNLVPQSTKIEVSKEDQKEVDAAKFKKPELELIFTDPNLVIPEEQAVFKNEDIDYNEMLDKIGYIDDSIVDIAADLNLTTAEFIEFRQTANGKKPLKPEYKRQLNHLEMTTLRSGMRNRILGKINDGQYTPEELPAEVAKSLMLGAPLVMTWGLPAEELVQVVSTDYGFDDLIDDDGYLFQNSTEEKTLIGLYGAMSLNISPDVFNNFVPGGQQVFVQNVKENLTSENISTMLTDTKFNLDAYSITGDSDFLPFVDSLNALEEQERLQKILNKINKFLYTPEDSVLTDDTVEEDNTSEDDNTSGETNDSTKVIQDSLNTNN